MEFDTEVKIEEDFSNMSWRDRLELIIIILKGETYEFWGEDTVSYTPDEFP